LDLENLLKWPVLVSNGNISKTAR